ncbi:hypothetical protein TNCV_4915611 [Trichonephila clavipes]|nr:hypothetical protein TNCV_4915611 [Trichonephila clavipes]
MSHKDPYMFDEKGNRRSFRPETDVSSIQAIENSSYDLKPGTVLCNNVSEVVYTNGRTTSKASCVGYQFDVIPVMGTRDVQYLDTILSPKPCSRNFFRLLLALDPYATVHPICDPKK